MASLATITSKNQLTLPVAITSTLGLAAGSKVFLKVEGNRLILEKPLSLRALNAQLSTLPQSKKFSVAKAIKIARKKEASRLAHEG